VEVTVPSDDRVRTKSDSEEIRAAAERWGKADSLATKPDLHEWYAAKAEWDRVVTPRAVLQLMYDTERLSEGETCQACGNRYGDVYAVSDETWQRITPKPDQPGAGLLCPACMAIRVEGLLIEATREIERLRKMLDEALAELGPQR
jgi:hypothetical protein